MREGEVARNADHSEHDSKGAKAGLETTWELAKVVVPTAVVVALLRPAAFGEHHCAFAPI